MEYSRYRTKSTKVAKQLNVRKLISSENQTNHENKNKSPYWFGVLFVQDCDAAGALLRALMRLRPWSWRTPGLIRLNLGCICYLCSVQSFLLSMLCYGYLIHIPYAYLQQCKQDLNLRLSKSSTSQLQGRSESFA